MGSLLATELSAYKECKHTLTGEDAPEQKRPTGLHYDVHFDPPHEFSHSFVDNIIPTLDKTVRSQSGFNNRARASILIVRRVILGLRIGCEPCEICLTSSRVS